MLTIGLPGFLAFAFYAVLYHLFMHLGASWLATRNESSPLAAAMFFVS